MAKEALPLDEGVAKSPRPFQFSFKTLKIPHTSTQPNPIQAWTKKNDDELRASVTLQDFDTTTLKQDFLWHSLPSEAAEENTMQAIRYTTTVSNEGKV